jgi:hypothetical protein
VNIYRKPGGFGIVRNGSILGIGIEALARWQMTRWLLVWGFLGPCACH